MPIKISFIYQRIDKYFGFDWPASGKAFPLWARHAATTGKPFAAQTKTGGHWPPVCSHYSSGCYFTL